MAVDEKSGAHRSIYGMGRFNHENDVADRATGTAGRAVRATTRSTARLAARHVRDARVHRTIWNDSTDVTLYGVRRRRSPNVNDYGDVAAANGDVRVTSSPCHADDRDRQEGPTAPTRESADFGYTAPPTGIPDGPQWVLEHWSRNVDQRVPVHPHRGHRVRPERTSNVVYFVDTGEPRAMLRPDDRPAAPRAFRARSGRARTGASGRCCSTRAIRSTSESLSVLVTPTRSGYDNPAAMHQAGQRRDDQANSLLDHGGSERPQLRSGDRLRSGLAVTTRVPHHDPRPAPGPAAELGRREDGQQLVPVALELRRADARDGGELLPAPRSAPDDLGQRGVVEDHVRGPRLGLRRLEPPALERLVERIVRLDRLRGRLAEVELGEEAARLARTT